MALLLLVLLVVFDVFVAAVIDGLVLDVIEVRRESRRERKRVSDLEFEKFMQGAAFSSLQMVLQNDIVHSVPKSGLISPFSHRKTRRKLFHPFTELKNNTQLAETASYHPSLAARLADRPRRDLMF